jgi:uncharacterized protein (DUF849 family)
MTTPVIIEVALTGLIDKKTNPNVPRTTDEIIASASACFEAGATIIHMHSDELFLGKVAKHSSKPYFEIIPRIYKKYPEALLYPTLPAGGPHTDITQRYTHYAELAKADLLRIAAIDPGTMNWQTLDEDGLPEANEIIYQNSCLDVRYVFDFCRKFSLGCTMSIFEPGFLGLVLGYDKAGRLPKGSIVKLEFSAGKLIFGLPPSQLSLEAYLGMLEGSEIPWMVTLRDGDLMGGFGQIAMKLGGHIRVGIEDYGGPRQPRNEELVNEVVEYAKKIGRPVASFAETSQILDLPTRR